MSPDFPNKQVLLAACMKTTEVAYEQILLLTELTQGLLQTPVIT